MSLFGIRLRERADEQTGSEWFGLRDSKNELGIDVIERIEEAGQKGYFTVGQGTIFIGVRCTESEIRELVSSLGADRYDYYPLDPFSISIFEKFIREQNAKKRCFAGR